jgi:hypothetical protein
VPQEGARRQGGEDEADRTDVSARPVPARGVPLLEQFVYDLGDPVVDRVAEAGQEFLVRPQVRVEPGGAAGWCRASRGTSAR